MAVIQRQRSIQAQGPQGLQARSIKMGDDDAIGATGQERRTAVTGICRREAGEAQRGREGGGGAREGTYRLCVVVVVIVFILSQ